MGRSWQLETNRTRIKQFMNVESHLLNALNRRAFLNRMAGGIGGWALERFHP